MICIFKIINNLDDEFDSEDYSCIIYQEYR
jgi:hypothetical protein